MKTRILLLAYILLPLCIFAQIDTTKTALDSLRLQFEHDVNQTRKEFEEFSEKARAEYEEYEMQARADYARYVESVQRVWGGDTICDNTRYQWVEYGNDYSSRSIVDFKNGNVLVEIVVDEKEMQDASLVSRRLETAVEKLLNSRGSTSPYPSSVETAAPLTAQPVLENLIDLSAYGIASAQTETISQQPVAEVLPPRPQVRGRKLADNSSQKVTKNISKEVSSSKNKKVEELSLSDKTRYANRQTKKKVDNWPKKVNTIAKKVVSLTKKNKGKVKGTDGKVRQVVQAEMSLVTNNLSKNAALYKDLVAEFSQRFQIEQPLIYAIMEQESYFNPEATSWVPAYGLMQLVPKSGGKDAFLYVYKKEWIPTRSYLYNPRNNIELGTAYLRILMNQFSSVSDVHCRRLCVIASYNTGAGNVSRSFVGTTKLGNAFSLINRYNYNQLYTHLTTRLSMAEARNYVAGVSKRREKYMNK